MKRIASQPLIRESRRGFVFVGFGHYRPRKYFVNVLSEIAIVWSGVFPSHASSVQFPKGTIPASSRRNLVQHNPMIFLFDFGPQFRQAVWTHILTHHGSAPGCRSVGDFALTHIANQLLSYLQHESPQFAQ